MKICFASDVHYPNYTKRVQESSLKSFLDAELYKFDVYYYISTNRPSDLIHLDGKNNVKIFDVDFLRKDNKNSLEFEILPKNPIGTYPSTFPYNLRRFIIEKAALDGFDYIIFLDADVIFRKDFNGEFIFKLIKSQYEPNKVKTNVHIFEYSIDSTSEVFSQHSKYLNKLDFDFSSCSLNTLDGPVMVFMGETNKDILKLIDVWHFITDFGYKKSFGFGYDNFFIANLSFVIPMSNFKLESCDFPFYPNHILEDRYDASYIAKLNEFDYEENSIEIIDNSQKEIIPICEEKTLHELGVKYGTDKSLHHNYLNIYEKYLKDLRKKTIRFLEIGVDKGESIKMWEEYFSDGLIYGVDIDDKKEYETNRTKILIGNQENETDLLSLPKNLDIIVDDGGHTMIQQQKTLNHLFNSHLKDGGFYIIEDLQTSVKEFGDACSYNWGATEKNNTLRLVKDFKSGMISNDSEYYLTNEEFKKILEKIEYINLYEIGWGSITCVIKKKNSTDAKEKNTNTLGYYLNKFSCEKSQNEFEKVFGEYFEYLKDKSPSILEIGVGSITLIPLDGMNHVPSGMYSWKEKNPTYEPGNILRVYRDYFVEGSFYGIDIQPDCKIDESNILTEIFDSRNPKTSDIFLKDKSFDLIIDDGDYDANIRIITFNNFFKGLKDEGYYVIQGLVNQRFLEEYFSSLDVPYFITKNYMVFNKKGDFKFLNKLTNVDTLNQELFEQNKNIDYSKLINESPNFSIGGIELADKGFYINLESSKERKDNVNNQIQIFNIEGLLRFDALKDSMIQYSCTKSHLSVFKTCLENNIETVFVAEDDFQIEEFLYLPNSEPLSFQEKINSLSNDLNKLEWDVFLFGCNPKAKLVPVTDNTAIVYKSTGAWAYIIKKRAYQFLLDNLNYKKDYIAIDDYLPLLNENGFTTLTSTPMTIGHAVGFISTLQPRGPVNYTDWIRGSYHKFLFDDYPDNNFSDYNIEKKLTIFIPGFFCENYLTYLRYALKSIPEKLRRCRFIIRFDIPTKDYDLKEYIKLQAYFRDVRNDLNVSLSYGFGGLISSFDYFLKNVKTPYFMMYEFDYVFLKKDNIDFDKIIQSFDKYYFINTVYFSGDDISVRGFDLATDKNGKVTPFELETRVSEINLVSTARWSNRPAIHRVSKMKEWFEKYMKNEHIGVLHQSCYGIEDSMIPNYHKVISENNWEDIKDDWGTYLYGNFGEGPFIAHTDSSKRYQADIKSTLEINADIYIIENPLTDND